MPMNQSIRGKATNSGFTIVEILVAMVIFALLMMLVSNAMSFSFGFWSRNHSQLDDKITHFIAFEKFTKSVKATQPYGVRNAERELELFFQGGETELSFVSDLGLYQPGPSLIILSLVSDDVGEQHIMVAEKPMSEMMFTDIGQFKEIELSWHMLFENVQSMRLEYFGFRDLTGLNEDALNRNPFADMNRNKRWFEGYFGNQTLILPEVIKLNFSQLRKGQFIERSMSFKIQINDLNRYILLNQHKSNAK